MFVPQVGSIKLNRWRPATRMIMPGSTGGYAFTPDAAVLTPSNANLSIIWHGTLTDWTPGSIQPLCCKYDGASNNEYGLFVNTNGTLLAVLGTNAATDFLSSTVAPTVTDGAALWLRFDADGTDVDFYTSTSPANLTPDAVTWTALGTPVAATAYTSFTNGTARLVVGAFSDGSGPSSGTVDFAEVRNGFAGAILARFDASKAGAGRRKFRSQTGEEWTIVQKARLI